MENIGILEKVREKRKEEARIRQLSGLKHSKVIVASNLTQREKPTDSNRLDESIRPQKGFLMDAEDILRMTPEQLDSEFYP